MLKILIIRFSSIGDIVLTSPVVRCLKLQTENAEIHFLTKKSFAAVVENNPYIDKVHLLENDLNALIKRLKKEQFDYIIDLHHNLRSKRVSFLLGVKTFAFNKLNIEKWLFTNFRINRLPAVHIVDRYMATAQTLGVKNDGQGLDFFIANRDRVLPEQLPSPHRNGYIGLVIGAALGTKRLPPEKLKVLCEKIAYPIVLLGGPQDKEVANALAAGHAHIFNACGQFNLGQSADLVRQARVIITHDTGLMHIAAAFSKPILVLWGNTVPAFGMYPYMPAAPAQKVLFFENTSISCRPCSKIGYDKCPKGHFKCMMDLPLDEIAARALSFT